MMGILIGVLWVVTFLEFGKKTTLSKTFDFLTSPGMAGLAAVIAAAVAAVNISDQIRQTKQAESRQNWWTNFKWAADRAVPSNNDAIAVPYSTSIATMRTLQAGTEDPLQKAACGTFVDLLAELASAQSEPGKTDPGRFQALREYNNATNGSEGRSAVAHRVIYLRDLLNELEHIAVLQGFGYAERVTLTPAKANDPVRLQGGSSAVDAELTRDRAKIIVKMRWWDAAPDVDTLQRRIDVTVSRIKQYEPKAAVILIVRFDVPPAISLAHHANVRVVKWSKDPATTAHLGIAINQLSAARQPRLRRRHGRAEADAPGQSSGLKQLSNG